MDLIIIINLIADIAQVFIKMIKYALIGNKIIKNSFYNTKDNKNISDCIYVNITSVSVYKSYAKCILGSKTLTLPTQDNR